MKVISRRARQHTITMYNYLSTTGGMMAFQRTVIKRVSLDTGYAQRLTQRGVSTTDAAQLIIDLRDIEVTDKRTFVPVEAWDTQEDKTKHFTFSTSKDFFIQGEVADLLPPTTKQQMQTKYQCFSVTSVAMPNSDILQILGK